MHATVECKEFAVISLATALKRKQFLLLLPMPLKIIFKFLKFFEILLALKIASIKSLAVRLETVYTVHAIEFVFIVYFGMSFAVPAEKILA